MAEQYEEEISELKLKPEYVEKMKKRQKESTVKIEELRGNANNSTRRVQET